MMELNNQETKMVIPYKSDLPTDEAVASEQPPVLVLVGADKGGVGKTTVARAVADYLLTLEPRLIDTQVPLGDLKGFYSKPKCWILPQQLLRCRSSTSPCRSR
jgi:hypothetical protein